MYTVYYIKFRQQVPILQDFAFRFSVKFFNFTFKSKLFQQQKHLANIQRTMKSGFFLLSQPNTTQFNSTVVGVTQ
jgi:hypothetical protein